MLNLLREYNKPIMVSGNEYENGEKAYQDFKNTEGQLEIIINHNKGNSEPKNEKRNDQKGNDKKDVNNKIGKDVDDEAIYRIKVKNYMTKTSTSDFDFMEKWNNDIPMPLIVMQGKILKETKGMYYMKLWGKPEKTSTCLKCGKRLTNKISVYYGLGPECGGHFYITPLSEDELDERLDEVRNQINNIKWEGWVIKKAIKEIEEI